MLKLRKPDSNIRVAAWVADTAEAADPIRSQAGRRNINLRRFVVRD
jgi:hypothetical protein